MLLVPVYSFATEFQSRFLLLWYLSIYETVAYLQWMPLVLCKYDGRGKKLITFIVYDILQMLM